MHLEFAPLSPKITGNGSRGDQDDTKHSFVRSLALYTGRYSDAKVWRIFARPIVMFFYPAVLWGFLIYGTTLTWIVVFSVVNGVLFLAPPYNFTVGQAGLTSLSPFVLCIIGEAISGPLNDWICVKMAKANKGIYEPEFRLVTMVIAVILGTVGFYGFGATVHYQTHWAGPVLTYGLANMSLAFASTCVFGYVLVSTLRTVGMRCIVRADTYTGFIPQACGRSFRGDKYSKHIDFRPGKHCPQRRNTLDSLVQSGRGSPLTISQIDLLCQRLAGPRRPLSSLQCSRLLLPGSLRADCSIVDLRETHTFLDR